MRSNCLCRCCRCLALVCLFSVPAYASDDSTFTVRSFLPTLFRDFQWQLDGDADFQALGEHRSRPLDSPDLGPDDGLHRIAHDRDADLYSMWRLRWEDEARHVDLDITLGGGYFDSTGNNDVDLDDWSGTLSEKTRENYDAHEAFYEAEIYGSLRQFVVADAFFQALGGVNYSRDRYRASFDKRDEIAERDTLAGETAVISRENYQDASTLYRRTSISSELSLGWGRTYHAEYAATAVFIADELRERGLLNRDMTSAELYGLAEQVHRMRLAIPTDERLYRIASVDSLVESLRSSGAVLSEGSLATLTILDVLDNFPQEERLFGWTLQAGYGVYGHFDSRDDRMHRRFSQLEMRTYDNSAEIDTLAHLAGWYDSATHYPSWFQGNQYLYLAAWYHVPLSARWQLDSRLSWGKPLDGEKDPPDYVQGEYVRTTDRTTADAQFELRYYHDARTEFSLEGLVQYIDQNTETSIRERQQQGVVKYIASNVRAMQTHAEISLNLKYWLSIRTTLKAGLAGMFNHVRFYEDFGWFDDAYAITLTAGITHYIF